MVSAVKISRASASKSARTKMVSSSSDQQSDQSGGSSTATIPSVLWSPTRLSPTTKIKHRRRSPYSRPHHSRRPRRPHHTSTLNDRDSIFYLNSGDHPGALMVSDKFVGENNYTTWANAMKLSLIYRRKIFFINDKVKKPESVNDKDYEAWETVNGLVLSWIVNGASPQIASTLMHTKTAYAAWADLQEREANQRK